VYNMEPTIILGSIDITALHKAATKLTAILHEPKNEFIRDAAIQRFEFTYELVWKTMKRILAVKGLVINNPRDVFREAAKQGIIDGLDVWFLYIEYRNQTTHVYNESVAEELYSKLPVFNTMVQSFLTTCSQMSK